MTAVVDAFADPATPEFRRSRPALVRARLAWGEQRRVAQATCIQGVCVGDRVMVELEPGLIWTGTVQSWSRGGTATALRSATVAEVLLDPGHLHSSHIVIRRRDRLTPLRKELK